MECRSNWLKRPLSEPQLKYASLDVEYLLHLYKLQNELSKTDKFNWHNQDVTKAFEGYF